MGVSLVYSDLLKQCAYPSSALSAKAGLRASLRMPDEYISSSRRRSYMV